MNHPFVELNVVNDTGVITFFHPQHNALPSGLLSLLVKRLKEANADDRISIIKLQSAGDRTFCAGANFDELLSISNFDSGKAFFQGFGNVINTIRTIDKLVIGRVQGKAVGGGVGLAAACDICFATQYASIRLSELSIGIGPFVIEPAVSRKIGKNTFAKLSLQPLQWMKATNAMENGLYAAVFEDAEKMDSFVNEYAERMSSYNPASLTAMKKMLWAGTEDWDVLLEERAALSGKLVLSDFTITALKKFKSK